MPRATKAVDAAKDPTKKSGATKQAASKEAASKHAAATQPAVTEAPAKKAAAKAGGVKASSPPPSPSSPSPSPSSSPKAPPVDKFLAEQEALLLGERATYEEQAAALKAQADQMAQEMEPGDIQFDDESGEGGTANIDRERDLALSAQARIAVDEIDHALAKIAAGTYGTCERCGQPIPRARLKALPQARLCISCKSGGLSRR
ncbi:MAG: TraR/DksA C4-type zinc finger protein [Actinomycetota bacterium]|nr:TraR/DksA C4-type zinc finger protein [Actinomycetota bacterium]